MFTNKAQSRRRLARAQASGQRLFESLERRDLFAGSISGNVYVDRNGSLAHDTGDAGYAGFPGPSATVYIDSNNNGTFDTGELGTVPDGLGNYSFNNLLNGVYVVRLVKPTGFINMAPSDGAATADLIGHSNVSGVDFGMFPTTLGPQGAGTNDSFSVMADPNDPTRTLINSNSGLNYTPLSIPSNLLPSLACSGLGGNDTLTVDERNGACIPAGGSTFNGDTGLDTVNYFGSQSGDAVTANATTLVAHGRTITPQGIDTLNIDGAGGNDSVVLTGVSSTLGNLTLAGGDGDDSFILASASFNTSITINGGNGNDVATMGSSTSSLSAGLLHFNGEAGDDAMFDYGSTFVPPVFDGGTGDDTATYYSLGGAVTVSDTNVSQPMAGFSFSNTEHLVVNGTPTADTFNITTTPNSPTVMVNGAAGDDVLNETSMAPIPAHYPTFNLGAGDDRLNLLSGEMILGFDGNAGGSNLTVNVSSAASMHFTSTQHLAALSIANNGLADMIPFPGGRLLVTRSLTLNGATAKLDLYDNDMILDYTGASQLAAIQQLINTARAGGTWFGNGIASFAALTNADRNTTLGAMEASDYHGVYGAAAAFDGETIDNSAVLVKYTYYGDADFNGKVNFDDYIRTDSGFNNHRTGWLNGDFDGNGVVGFDDYVLIDLAFNTQGSAL